MPQNMKNSPGSNVTTANYKIEDIEHVAPSVLHLNPRNARTHSKRQIAEIGRSLRAFGFVNPILADETGMVLAGHGRLEAAKSLGLAQVPVLRLAHLNETQKRAFVLADNKLAAKAGWDRSLLAIELGDLAVLLTEADLDVTITGFDVGEIDMVLADHAAPPLPQGLDALDAPPTSELLRAPLVTRRGDVWVLSQHRISCGDARDDADIARLMEHRRAAMAFIDPPYNVRVAGHVQSRGVYRHDEFAFASGEMTEAEFTAFLTKALQAAARVSRDGALHYVCVDWRHIVELITAGRQAYAEQINLCVWAKTNAGQGSFYRSQHELIGVFRVGSAPHRNGVELGRHGRSRTNLWTYGGASAFKTGGKEELSWHPTVKPVALVADAIRDSTLKGELILDTFLGSGTTLLAAERVGRVCCGMEYDPKYVDVAVRRWQAFTGKDAICSDTGKTFEEIAQERATGRDDSHVA